jgi:hypothetical protein
VSTAETPGARAGGGRATAAKAAGAVERERRRLQRVFGAAVLAVAAPQAFVACSQRAGSLAPEDGGGADTAIDDGGDAGDGRGDATSPLGSADGPGTDCANNKGCNTIVYADAAYYPDGTDAEICPLLLPCGLPAGTDMQGCEVVDTAGNPIGCRVPDDAGCVADAFAPTACGMIALRCLCDIFVGGGRRTARTARTARAVRKAGLRSERRVRPGGSLGRFLARVAEEEAMSVGAFRRLHAELSLHGGPRSLLVEVARSAADEVRHARATKRLAARYGGEPALAPRGRSASRRARPLEEIAVENAVEGCVRETYGALLATWQAAHARDRALGRAFARIARDETRHAALAWAIARWARTRLGARAAARVEAAKRAAMRRLAEQLAAPVPEPVVVGAGVPRPHEARALLRAMARGLATARPPSP